VPRPTRRYALAVSWSQSRRSGSGLVAVPGEALWLTDQAG
jgi:hypothetical protein